MREGFEKTLQAISFLSEDVNLLSDELKFNVYNSEMVREVSACSEIQKLRL